MECGGKSHGAFSILLQIILFLFFLLSVGGYGTRVFCVDPEGFATSPARGDCSSILAFNPFVMKVTLFHVSS
jgi:hypothetical protein